MITVHAMAPVAEQTLQAPPPAPGLPGFSAVAVVLMILSVMLVLWKRRRGAGGYRRTVGGAAMGNALIDLNAIYQPHHANAAVICKLEEEEERDEAGEGPTPWTPPPRPRMRVYREDGPPN
ncbi:MAG: hypothetical protein AAGA54_09835 [Myxococcota bacterium]